MLEFGNGQAKLVAAKVSHEGLLVGQKISALKEHIPNTEGRIAAIYRDGQPLLPDGDTIIRADDEVFFIAAKKDIRAFMTEMRKIESPVRRVLIAGGGHIGVRLASALEKTNQVKIIEHDPARAKLISEKLDDSIVLVGDASDQELLSEEDVDNVDVFCSLTNSEEANILSAKEIVDAPLATCQEVGWLMVDNKEKIVVMRSWCIDKDDNHGGGAIAIPKGWVTKIEYLEVSYGERNKN